MAYNGKFQAFEDIIKEIKAMGYEFKSLDEFKIMIVYHHDARPWLIGYSGGKIPHY